MSGRELRTRIETGSRFGTIHGGDRDISQNGAKNLLVICQLDVQGKCEPQLPTKGGTLFGRSYGLNFCAIFLFARPKDFESCCLCPYVTVRLPSLWLVSERFCAIDRDSACGISKGCFNAKYQILTSSLCSEETHRISKSPSFLVTLHRRIVYRRSVECVPRGGSSRCVPSAPSPWDG